MAVTGFITKEQIALLLTWGVIFFLCALVYGFYVSWKYERRRLNWRQVIGKEWRVMIVFAIILASLLTANVLFPAEKSSAAASLKWLIITASLLITITWFQFLRKADVFEKENLFHLLTVMLGGIAAGIGAVILDSIYAEHDFHFKHALANDFFYCTFGIGFRDELLKFIPVLLLMVFSRAINESYDYILYACVSALGFSLVENIHHAESVRLELIHSKIMYSVVAQMFFSSIAAYGIVLSKYRYNAGIVRQTLSFLGFICWASLAHGFYEYWSVNEYVATYKTLSAVFLLGSLFIWTVLRNNALNNSEFFDESVDIKIDKLQSYLVITLTAVFMFEYISMAWMHGHSYANASFILYGYDSICLIVFFSVNTTRIKLIKGDWNPLKFSLSTDYIDAGEFDDYFVEITNSRYSPRISRHLPLSGKIERRVMVEGTKHSNAWITELDKPHAFDAPVNDKVIVELYSQKSIIHTDKKVMARLFLVKAGIEPDTILVQRNNLKLAGWVMVRRVIEP